MEIDDAVTKAVKEHNYTLAGIAAKVIYHRFKLSYTEVRAWFKQLTEITNEQFDKMMNK